MCRFGPSPGESVLSKIRIFIENCCQKWDVLTANILMMEKCLYSKKSYLCSLLVTCKNALADIA